MIGYVIVHTREGVYFVQSYDRNTSNVWLGSREPTCLSPEASADAVGQAVIDALHQSRLDVELSPLADLTEPLLTAAGVRSYSAFTKGLKTVGVDADDDALQLMIEVTPSYRDNKGFASWNDKAKSRFAYSSPSQVGQAVLDSLELTTPT